MNDLTNTLSNWGRWGDDDQRGSPNLITADEIKAAAGLVKEGKVYSLSMPLEADGPQWPDRHKTWQTTSLLDFGDGKVKIWRLGLRRSRGK